MSRIRTVIAALAVFATGQAAFGVAPRTERRVACCCAGAASCGCPMRMPAADSGDGCSQCGPSDSRSPASDAAERQRPISRQAQPTPSLGDVLASGHTATVVPGCAFEPSPESSRERLARISLLRI